MNEYFHGDTKSDLEFLYWVILGGGKISNKEDLINFRASYFAMSVLLPHNLFNKVVQEFGGYYHVVNNRVAIRDISNIFFVPEKLVECRIKVNLSPDIVDEINAPSEIKVLLRGGTKK